MEKKIKHFNNVSKIICTLTGCIILLKKLSFKDKLLTEIPLILDNEVWKPLKKKFQKFFWY